MKKVMLLLMLAGWCAYGYAGKGPTVSLYKIMRDGQRRDTTVLHLQKMKDGGYMLRVPQKELEEMEFLQVVPRMAVGHQGEKGWFIDNNSLQVRYDVQHKQKPYQIQWEEKYLVSDDLKDVTDGIQSTMGWDAGSLCISGYHEAKTKKTWLAVKEGMKFECRQLAKLKDGEYSLIDAYYLRDIKPYEDLTIFYYPVKGDTYTDIALRYREWLIEHDRIGAMLKEKAKARPEVAYSTDAPEIRIRMGWKESPSPIEEQTRENEPPMHVAITFDRVCDIIDALVAKGVKKAELCLVGWNISGHDGRFPEMFPPEPALGGYEGLAKVVRKAKEVGYRIDLHTCHTDIYSICEDWDDGYHAAKDIHGHLKSKNVYGGGRMYDICMKQSYEKFFKRDEPKMVELGIHGLHYIDVLSIITPHDCFDPRHPLNKKEAAEYSNRMLEDCRTLFGGSQSEGGKDWTAKYLDYALYTSWSLHTPEGDNIYDAYFPMWHIVFNGYVMSNPSNVTVNFPIKPIVDAIKVVEYAGRPAFYFYSSFKANMSQNWMGGTLDLRCATDEELDEAVTQIKKGYDIFQEYRHLLYETLDKHEALQKDVYCSTFSNGEKIVCNYSSQPYRYKDTVVAAKSYRIVNSRK